jgi:hypothetical protein
MPTQVQYSGLTFAQQVSIVDGCYADRFSQYICDPCRAIKCCSDECFWELRWLQMVVKVLSQGTVQNTLTEQQLQAMIADTECLNFIPASLNGS